MSEDLRGVFFIVKGQYKKGVEPSFLNKVTNETSWLGGYDPRNENTSEWYMCLDNITFKCVACGGDLEKVVKGVHTQIVKYKDLKHYLRHISKTTSDDTYEVRYLGRTPLTHDQRVKKAEGRCPRTSPAMRCLYEAIYSEYGDYYSDLVETQEDLAYEEIKNNTPFKKVRKLVKKTSVTQKVITPKKVVEQTPKDTTPPKDTPLKKIGSIKPKKVTLRKL